MLAVLVPVVPFILIIGVIWWYQNFSRVGRHINKLDGPGYPIVGVFLDYLSGDLEKVFQNDRDRCAKYSPIFKLWIFHKATVILQKPDDIEIILSSTKHIKKSQIYDNLHMWLGTGLLTSDGDKWKSRRKILTPAFHFAILKGFVDVFNEATESLVKDLTERAHEDYIDVVPPITQFTVQSMAETSMGTSLDLTQQINRNYKKAILDFTEIALYRLTKPWLYDENLFKLIPSGKQATKIVNTLHEFTRNIIHERKKSFKSSYTTQKRLAMLDLLLKAQETDGAIDDEGIREEVDTFMFEGHDTTAVAICHILMLLANHKNVQDEVRQEIFDIIGDNSQPPSYSDLQELAYTERCIKECLRLYPSVTLIGRDINEDVQTSTGYIIPKGTMAHIFIYDLHRNPDLYPDPLKFDPDRFLPENIQKRHPFAYIPFSAGSRNCIGQRFAMLELKALLCGILRKFNLEAVDRPEDIVFQADLVLRSKNPIRVKFITRN
ncbi:hypothetical protein Zmor_025642 [Zophobas morio]|uniref:Cytochrome P450 4C1 n=1 Tax=Zophobas morio TaxID=2755281 RepID=A0AA38M4S8_9CUCU|nr:hypothetical protein Zmor_025642 [Zophobas morio]